MICKILSVYTSASALVVYFPAQWFFFLHNLEVPNKYYNSVRFLGVHGGDYEEWCLLGCYTLWLL
jgi:hypothetical protein